MVLSKANPAITAVLSSPLTRALETGELVTRELPSKPEITKTEHLCPGFRHKELFSQLNGLNHDSVILIGHQPDMSTFLSLLIGDDQTTVEMATCAVALVRLSRPAGPRSGVLRWLFTPELLRVLKTP
jgi:phosphohistidine phosphatase SixA